MRRAPQPTHHIPASDLHYGDILCAHYRTGPIQNTPHVDGIVAAQTDRPRMAYCYPADHIVPIFRTHTSP